MCTGRAHLCECELWIQLWKWTHTQIFFILYFWSVVRNSYASLSFISHDIHRAIALLFLSIYHFSLSLGCQLCSPFHSELERSNSNSNTSWLVGCHTLTLVDAFFYWRFAIVAGVFLLLTFSSPSLRLMFVCNVCYCCCCCYAFLHSFRCASFEK